MGTRTEAERNGSPPPPEPRCEHCDAPASVQLTFARRTVNLCDAHWEAYGAGASFLALDVRNAPRGRTRHR